LKFCRSAEWGYIPADEKQQIGLTFDDDGEFWMSYRDFVRHFTRMEICHLDPSAVDDSECKKWETSSFEGEWVRGVTAGGCRNYPSNYFSIKLNSTFKIQNKFLFFFTNIIFLRQKHFATTPNIASPWKSLTMILRQTSAP